MDMYSRVQPIIIITARWPLEWNWLLYAHMWMRGYFSVCVCLYIRDLCVCVCVQPILIGPFVAGPVLVLCPSDWILSQQSPWPLAQRDYKRGPELRHRNHTHTHTQTRTACARTHSHKQSVNSCPYKQKHTHTCRPKKWNAHAQRNTHAHTGTCTGLSLRDEMQLAVLAADAVARAFIPIPLHRLIK